MMIRIKLWNCFKYYIVLGVLGFAVGRLVPKKCFHHDSFPYRAFAWEREGEIYKALHIRKWHNKVPDMSKILRKLMPEKKLPEKITEENVLLMIRETCVAEWIHKGLCFLGFGCLWIWRGVGGVIVSTFYFLVNLVYVIIQRYNRPRLEKLLIRVKRNKQIEKGNRYACTDPQL